MTRYNTEELLILTKTYPSPSSKYREITCVAAVNRAGEMRRLFPVPFRLLAGEHQFKKWEWIRANVTQPRDDRRPESRRIDVDSIVRGARLGTGHGWAERWEWIRPHVVESFSALEARRLATGETLGFLRPQLLSLEITPVRDPEWTDDDRAKLLQEGLFDSTDVKARSPLKKLPYNFYYHYECQTAEGVETHRHKLIDWEVGALYWNCYYNHGDRWERPFRQKLEEELAQKDLLLLMGNMHRLPHQWLIVGPVYPPKQSAVQLSLFGPTGAR